MLQIALFLIVLFTVPIKVISQNCSRLKRYRDVELVAQFDYAKEKYTKKYKLNNDAIADAKKMKNELLNERSWNEFMSIGNAKSEDGETIAQISQVIKSFCDLLVGLSEMMPVEAAAMATVKTIKMSALQVYNIIKAGQDLKEVVEGNLEMVSYKAALGEIGIAGKAAKTALEFNKNMVELMKIPEERKKLKSEVTRILNMLDNAIDKYQQDLEKSKEKLNNVIEIEQGITRYLKENCKDEDEIEKLLKKELSKTNKYELTPVTPNSTTYFMYFFLDVGLGEYFFSPPISYKINDDPEIVKDRALNKFKAQIISQAPGIDENKFLWYITTKFKFDGDIKDDWIKTEADCKMFVENEKQKIKNNWNGGSSKLKIIQLH